MRIMAFGAALAMVLAACSSSTTPSGSGSGSGTDTDGGSGGGTSGGDGTPEQACVDAINMYRQTVGAPALTRWTSNETCTDGQAKSDSSSGKAHGAFGQCSEMAQDECPGWPGPPGTMITACLKQMWAEGPGSGSAHGHYNNMSNASYTQVSCGFYTLPDGSVWAVQNFK